MSRWAHATDVQLTLHHICQSIRGRKRVRRIEAISETDERERLRTK